MLVFYIGFSLGSFSLATDFIPSAVDLLDQNISKTGRLKSRKEGGSGGIRDESSPSAVNRTHFEETSSVESLFLLAQVYGEKEDYENQVRVLRRLIAKDRKNGKYWLKLIKALRLWYFKTHELNYKKETVDAIRQVKELKLNRKYQELAQLEMLSLLQNQKDIKLNHYAILELYNQLVRNFGKKKMYIRGVCEYLYINQFYQKSLSNCKKAIQNDPRGVSNYVYYALSLKDPLKKETNLKQVADRFSKSFLAQLKAGDVFFGQKNYKKALFYYSRAVRLNSQSVEAQVGLAQSLFSDGQFKKSYSHFLKACLLDRQEALWIFKKAKSLLNQKNKFVLAEFFEKGMTKCSNQNKPSF